jgi:hypothetical protein
VPRLFSQSGIAKSLKIGNKWIYQYYWPGRSEGRFYEFIHDDTSFAQMAYAVVERGPTDNQFERADTNRIYQYLPRDSSESTVCDFRLKVGDRFGPYTVTQTYSREIWGMRRKVVHFFYQFCDLDE